MKFKIENWKLKSEKNSKSKIKNTKISFRDQKKIWKFHVQIQKVLFQNVTDDGQKDRRKDTAVYKRLITLKNTI